VSEIHMMIPAQDFELEACYEEGQGPAVGILCHPHPLYGGSMDNNVIAAMQSALRARGWGTMRFNFRGVGRSGGGFAEGEGEAEDVMAIASFLSLQGKTIVHLGGYSFGAWIVLKALGLGLQAISTVLVSPPIDFLPFDNLKLPQTPCLITLGDGDSFCTGASLKAWLAGQPDAAQTAETEIVPGCDHFYWGREGFLEGRISKFLKKHFP